MTNGGRRRPCRPEADPTPRLPTADLYGESPAFYERPACRAGGRRDRRAMLSVVPLTALEKFGGDHIRDPRNYKAYMKTIGPR
jgi:hypothetical protein